MKQRIVSLLVGIAVGAVMFGGNAAQAAVEYLKALPSQNAIYVDGELVQMEAYAINGHNYVKLRDIGQAVGFNVYWNGSVQIDSSQPYTGEAPAETENASQQTTPPSDVVQSDKAPAADSYIITADHWSREDFSRQANSAVFTGPYTRELYNTFRQTLTDLNRQDAADYRFAYTMVNDSDYSVVKNLMGRMDGVLRYEHYVPANLSNYYEHLDYFSVSARMPDNYRDAYDFIQPTIAIANGFSSDRDKVTYLNDYLCSLLTYDRKSTAGIARTFSEHGDELKGACGTYAVNFNFLCAAANIPCMIISSDNHSWNLVYVDGEWLHVDVANNDVSANKHNLLLSKTSLGYVDEAPDMTAFLKELIVPGSTS